MNTSVPSGPGMSQQPVLQNFASPPLAQEFTYQTITTEIYHEKVPTDRGIFTLTITVGFLDTTGGGFYPVNSSETTLAPDSEVNSLFIKYDHKLLEDEYLCIRIHITNTIGYPLDIYWGNSTYPSRISYDGTAFYVPEFPSFLILPLFMTATLLAVIVYRRKHTM